MAFLLAISVGWLLFVGAKPGGGPIHARVTFAICFAAAPRRQTV